MAWHHADRVSRALQTILDRTREGDASDGETIVLAALTHDILEDAPDASEEELHQFIGPDGLELVRSLTNRGGLAGVPGYVRQIMAGSEGARLIKLADIADNCASVTYALGATEIVWVEQMFLPTVEPMMRELVDATFDAYPRAASHLCSLVRDSHAALVEELARCELDAYTSTTLAAIEMLSRSVRGTLDASASADKATYLLKPHSPADLSALALRNARSAVELAFTNRDATFLTMDALKAFIERLVRTVNQGIVRDGPLLRHGSDARRHSYTRIADLPQRYEDFVGRLFERLRRPPHRGDGDVDLAAWIEYTVDIKDHFFVDGCGRTARILAAWARMRERRPFPRYPSRDQHYHRADSIDLESFAAYYQALSLPITPEHESGAR